MIGVFSEQFLLKVLSGRTSNVFRIILFKELKMYNQNLTKQQWVLLSVLWRENGCTQNYLSKNIYRDYPTTSRLIDSLEEEGYVKRKQSEKDRRVHLIFLTEKGGGIEKEVINIINKVVVKATQNIPAEQLEFTQKLLDKIFSNI